MPAKLPFLKQECHISATTIKNSRNNQHLSFNYGLKLTPSLSYRIFNCLFSENSPFHNKKYAAKKHVLVLTYEPVKISKSGGEYKVHFKLAYPNFGQPPYLGLKDLNNKTMLERIVYPSWLQKKVILYGISLILPTNLGNINLSSLIKTPSYSKTNQNQRVLYSASIISNSSF